MSARSIDGKTEAGGISDQLDWLMVLLFAPDDDGVSQPIYGEIHLICALYLASEHLIIPRGTFDFERSKYGPRDDEILSALNKLIETERVVEVPPEQHDSSKQGYQYSLSERGKAEADKLWSRLSDDQQDVIKWIKYDRINESTGRMLSDIYGSYPEMFKPGIV